MALMIPPLVVLCYLPFLHRLPLQVVSYLRFGKDNDMSDDKKFEWRILGQTVIGASHVRTGKPNQDALLSRQAQADKSGTPLFIAIADGHGGDKYFRSDIGAKTAVEVTEHTLHRFVGELEVADRSNIKSTATIKQMAEKLPNSILY